MPLQFYARARFQSEIWGKDASKQTLGPRRESEHATRATKAGREKGEREKERERQARRQEGKGPGVADARARLCGSECAGYITGRMPSFFSLALIVVATTRSNSTKKGCVDRARGDRSCSMARSAFPVTRVFRSWCAVLGPRYRSRSITREESR